jgi:hypothetical protein
LKPGTVTLPAEEADVVVRISNPEVRIQNEVAAMALMRQALVNDYDSLVPAVFGWAPSSNGCGWIVQQYMRGTPLDKGFEALDDESLRRGSSQIAKIFQKIQSYRFQNRAST